MKKTLFICFIILCGYISLKATAQDKQQIFKNLVSQYGNIESITIEAKSSEIWAPVNLKAKRGNKFHMTLGDSRFISNGKTVWNYNPARKIVIISNYEDVCGDANTNVSLDNFFFNVLQKLHPVSLSSILDSKKGKQNLLQLQNEDPAQDLQQVNLYLDASFKTIEDIEIVTPSGTQKFQINKLVVNPKISDNSFNFQVPKDIEVVDER